MLASVVGLTASAGLQAAARGQEGGPVYSLEGAWYGITTFEEVPGAMPIIAATAVLRGDAVATRDLRSFPRIHGLDVVTW